MRLCKVHLRDILSFRDAALSEIGSVNLLIGANASGKSNFLDALSLLQAAPSGLAKPIVRGGGFREWIWKGAGSSADESTIECELATAESTASLRYLLSLQESNGGFVIRQESLARLQPGSRSPGIVFDRRIGNVLFSDTISRRLLKDAGGEKISSAESVLAAFRDPSQKRELTEVGKAFGDIRIFKNFDTSAGPGGGARNGVSTSYLPTNVLAEDGFNVALILNRMRIDGRIHKVEAYLHEYGDRFGNVEIDVSGGVARIDLKESGLATSTPGARLSDGTLKFLCLMAALFNNASDSSFVCIDEPETGLHPDAVRLLARAIREASKSTQFVIATHSDALVDEFSDTPEAVVVCESDPHDGTRFTRLSRRKLKTWLKDYSLGELWKKGTIGGNPW
jgi:predicted ATPase